MENASSNATLTAMAQRVRDRIERRDLLPFGASVLVGWSGGADSTVLLHILRELDFEVVAGHLDHGQRPESAEQAEALGRQAEAWGIAFVKGRADVPEIARVRKIGLEEAGREARYTFFDSASRATGCEAIATGHSRTDLAETVLFNLVRGSGLRGLRGIPDRRDGVVRPLLGETRADIAKVCSEIGFVPIEDPANRDLHYSRNRLRLVVVPELELVHAGAEAAIARCAEIVAEEDAFLDSAAAAGLERCEVADHSEFGFLVRDSRLAFHRDLLAHMPAVLRRRALSLAARTLGGSLNRDLVLAIDGAIERSEDGSWTAQAGRIAVTISGDELSLLDLQAPVPARYPLGVGTTSSDEFGWEFELGPLIEPSEFDLAFLVFDGGKAKAPLHLRAPQDGDALIPLLPNGSAGKRQSLRELMRDAGIPTHLRHTLPIVCDLGGPIWVPGVASAERVALDEESGKRTTLVFRRTG